MRMKRNKVSRREMSYKESHKEISDHRFFVESLESREMLAGNVNVVVIGGNLKITGDNSDNQIAIRATSNANEFDIEALDGETINQTTVTVTGNITINMKNGDNKLLLTSRNLAQTSDEDFIVPGNLKITTGSGDDSIGLDRIIVVNNTTINTKGGDDGVLAFDYGSDGNFTARTGGGNDAVAFKATSSILGKTKVISGGDVDCVLLGSSNFGDTVTVKTGGGDDLIATSMSSFSGKVVLNGGGGTDDFLDNGDNSFTQDPIVKAEMDFSGTINDVLSLFAAHESYHCTEILIGTIGSEAPVS